MKTNAFRIALRFICPECGSKDAQPPGIEAGLKKGHGLRYTLTCARCRWKIPAHLAERWGGLSIEAARQEWHHVYRGVFAEAADGTVICPGTPQVRMQ